MSDEFEQWLNESGWAAGDQAAKRFAQEAFAAGQAAAKEESAAKIGKLKNYLKICLPIVKEAYWDEHTAGKIPGSGFSHKAQHLAGKQFDWYNSDRFEKFYSEALQELEKEGV